MHRRQPATPSRRVLAVAVVFPFASAGPAACGEGGGTSGGAAGAGNIDYLAPVSSMAELRDRLEAVWCDHIEPCCDQYGIDFTQEGCREGVRGYVDASGTFVGHQFDPAMADRCIELSLQAAGTCPMPWELIEAMDSACSLVMGGFYPGESCGFVWNCAPQTDGVASCYSSQCIVTVSSGLDEPCGELPNFRVGECEAGLFCADGRCVPTVPLGAPCTGLLTHECGDNGFCQQGVCTYDPPSCTTEGCPEDQICDLGTCEPALADGEPCAQGICRHNSRCRCPSVQNCSTSQQRCFPGNLPSFCWDAR